MQTDLHFIVTAARPAICLSEFTEAVVHVQYDNLDDRITKLLETPSSLGCFYVFTYIYVCLSVV